MEIFELDALQKSRQEQDKLYLEFLRHPSMSVGLYELAAGSQDPQQPHNEDELYYIISGRGMIQVGDEDEPVAPGSSIFVKAHVPHKFHSISEDLSILVVFSPAETQTQ